MGLCIRTNIILVKNWSRRCHPEARAEATFRPLSVCCLTMAESPAASRGSSKSLRILRPRSVGVKGFCMNDTPGVSISARINSPLYPVMYSIFVWGRSERTCFARVGPFIPGIITSVKSRSTEPSLPTMRKASRPSGADNTLQPEAFKASQIKRRSGSASSTTSTVSPENTGFAAPGADS